MADLRTLLITGTSKGLGEYLAHYYVERGYLVVGCSRGESAIDKDNYHHIIADIASEKEILNIFKFIRKEFKVLYGLINNAAINPSISPAAFLSYESIERVYKTNVFAPMIFCRESIKLMARAKKGRIINIGSMAAKLEVKGEPLYTSAKAALNSYTRVIAKEVYNLGITANVIAPAALRTELAAQINQEALKEVLAGNAINDYGEMEDVTNSIDFLLSEKSTAITGQLIYLGGV